MRRYTAFALLAASTFALSCTSNDAPAPSNDITQLQGQYTTNGLLDPNCIFIPDDKFPSLTIKKQPNGTFRLVRTDYIPSKSTNTLDGVSVRVTPDTTFVLRDGQQIGKLFVDTFPNFSSTNPRDITAPRLSITYSDQAAQKFLSYYGYRR